MWSRSIFHTTWIFHVSKQMKHGHPLWSKKQTTWPAPNYSLIKQTPQCPKCNKNNLSVFWRTSPAQAAKHLLLLGPSPPPNTPEHAHNIPMYLHSKKTRIQEKENIAAFGITARDQVVGGRGWGTEVSRWTPPRRAGSNSSGTPGKSSPWHQPATSELKNNLSPR